MPPGNTKTVGLASRPEPGRVAGTSRNGALRTHSMPKLSGDMMWKASSLVVSMVFVVQMRLLVLGGAVYSQGAGPHMGGRPLHPGPFSFSLWAGLVLAGWGLQPV